jgi:hypothetical protein
MQSSSMSSANRSLELLQAPNEKGANALPVPTADQTALAGLKAKTDAYLNTWQTALVKKKSIEAQSRIKKLPGGLVGREEVMQKVPSHHHQRFFDVTYGEQLNQVLENTPVVEPNGESVLNYLLNNFVYYAFDDPSYKIYESQQELATTFVNPGEKMIASMAGIDFCANCVEGGVVGELHGQTFIEPLHYLNPEINRFHDLLRYFDELKVTRGRRIFSVVLGYRDYGFLGGRTTLLDEVIDELSQELHKRNISLTVLKRRTTARRKVGMVIITKEGLRRIILKEKNGWHQKRAEIYQKTLGYSRSAFWNILSLEKWAYHFVIDNEYVLWKDLPGYKNQDAQSTEN